MVPLFTSVERRRRRRGPYSPSILVSSDSLVRTVSTYVHRESFNGSLKLDVHTGCTSGDLFPDEDVGDDFGTEEELAGSGL